MIIAKLRSAVLSAAVAASALLTSVASSASERLRAGSIASWAYQLQGDMAPLTRSSHDLLVVDIDNVSWQTSAKALSVTADGRPRVVISYLSIGEAEDSRPYYQQCCATSRPKWLTDKTQGWPGNFAVRFWEPEWQANVLARVEALIAAGYTGAYLDRLDVWETWATERPTARADMLAFVARIAAHARSKAAGFVIVVQNAEELLDDPSHLAVIDGIAKEDLFYGVNHDGKRNASDVIDYGVRDLQRARTANKSVFVVEYVPLDANEADVRAEIVRQGFVPLIAGRDLDGK